MNNALICSDACSIQAGFMGVTSGKKKHTLRKCPKRQNIYMCKKKCNNLVLDDGGCQMLAVES